MYRRCIAGGRGDNDRHRFLGAAVRLLCLILSILTLVSCAVTPRPLPPAVPIFIDNCPEPPSLWRPPLVLNNLRPGDPAAAVFRAYRFDLLAVMGYAAELEIIINGYRGAVTNDSN